MMGLESGNFDDDPVLDLLGWGDDRMFVTRAGVTTVFAGFTSVRSVTALEWDAPSPGFVLWAIGGLILLDDSGQQLSGVSTSDTTGWVESVDGLDGAAIADAHGYVVELRAADASPWSASTQ